MTFKNTKSINHSPVLKDLKRLVKSLIEDVNIISGSFCVPVPHEGLLPVLLDHFNVTARMNYEIYLRDNSPQALSMTLTHLLGDPVRKFCCAIEGYSDRDVLAIVGEEKALENFFRVSRSFEITLLTMVSNYKMIYSINGHNDLRRDWWRVPGNNARKAAARLVLVDYLERLEKQRLPELRRLMEEMALELGVDEKKLPFPVNNAQGIDHLTLIEPDELPVPLAA